MDIQDLGLVGVKLFRLETFEDSRGGFSEIVNQESLMAAGSFFVKQVNHSRSNRNVFRGMHLQSGSHAQSKLVYCVGGSIVDYVLDVNCESETYGEYLSIPLSSASPMVLFVPRGYAHGFLALEDDTSVIYFVDKPRVPEAEVSIDVMSTNLGQVIADLPLVRSKKDLAGQKLEDYLHVSPNPQRFGSSE